LREKIGVRAKLNLLLLSHKFPYLCRATQKWMEKLSEGQFFTKADWRPGRRRRRIKRVKLWGGAKTANPAFMEASKATRFKPRREGARICTATKRDGTPCRMLALKGIAVCGAHGGFSAWARRGILQKTGKKQAIHARRAAAIEGQSESAPAALARMPIYREADQRVRMKLIAAYNTTAWTSLLTRLMKKEQEDIDVCV
jgi:hypothetical protein